MIGVVERWDTGVNPPHPTGHQAVTEGALTGFARPLDGWKMEKSSPPPVAQVTEKYLPTLEENISLVTYATDKYLSACFQVRRKYFSAPDGVSPVFFLPGLHLRAPAECRSAWFQRFYSH